MHLNSGLHTGVLSHYRDGERGGRGFYSLTLWYLLLSALTSNTASLRKGAFCIITGKRQRFWFQTESESLSVVSDSLRLYSPWNSPGQNTRVGSLSLLQGIFLTQGLNPGLPHCGQILYPAESQGKPKNIRQTVQEASHFNYSTSGSSQPRDQTQVSCIADRFFTS